MVMVLIRFLMFAVIIGAGSSAQLVLADTFRLPLYTQAVSLNPYGVQDMPSLFVSRQINCQLVRMKSHEFIFEIAENIKTLDPLNIQIILKNDQKFSNGETIVAKDIAATLNSLKSSRQVLKSIINSIHEIHVKSKNELIITLDRPIPHFMKLLAGPNYAIFPEEFIKKTNKNPSLWQNPVGCGHFKIVGNGPIIKLKHIHKDLSIEFHLVGGQTLDSIDYDQFDIIDAAFFDFVKNKDKFRTEKIFDPKQLFISVNAKLKRWVNKANRCNFLNSVNLNPILAGYENSSPELAKSFFPKGVVGYTPNSPYANINKPSETTIFKNLCLSFLNISVQKENFKFYNQSLTDSSKNITNKIIPSNSQFGIEFLKSKCDAFIYGLKSNYLDGYEYLVVALEPPTNVSNGDFNSIAKTVSESQKTNDSVTRAAGYQLAESMIYDQCIIRPLITLPYKNILVKKDLTTKNIGAGSINEYSLSEVVREN